MSSQITPEHIQASEEMCRALREAIARATGSEKDALQEQLTQADNAHQELCRAQTAELQQIYLQNHMRQMGGWKR